MIKVNLKQAKGDLEHLVDEAAEGQEVIITRGDGARFRIVPLPPGATELRGATTGPRAIGRSLDRFMGVWSTEEAAEFLKSVEVFEEIDESLWS